jgi:hypothetical protein
VAKKPKVLTTISEPALVMARTQTSCMALTVGQLARRWGVSADRVRQLIRSGHLPGVFTIPSAGRYGATVKVLLASVVRLETEGWALTPEAKGRVRTKASTRSDKSGPAFRHFLKLRASPEQPASGSGGGAPG